MPEFTVVLNDDRLFDIFIDGEHCYSNFTIEELKEFSEAFALSNEFED